MFRKLIRFVFFGVVAVIVVVAILGLLAINDALTFGLQALGAIMALIAFLIVGGIMLSILKYMVRGRLGAFFLGWLALSAFVIFIDSVAKNMLLDYQPLFFYVFDCWPLSILRSPLWTVIGEGYPYVGDAIGILFYAGLIRIVVRLVGRPKSGTVVA